MGGVKVNADSQMTTVPGLFAAGECAAGLHGANRLGGNSLSDLLVFGKLAGEYAAKFAKENSSVNVNDSEVDAVVKDALAPFERDSNSDKENPYQIQHDLQDMMQDLVGIARVGQELEEAIRKMEDFWFRARKAASGGARDFNPGWHTALELKHMLTVAEAIARSANERKESRGGHFREDYPDKSAEFGKVNTCIVKDASGKMMIKQVPKEKMREDLQQLIEEFK
jgi:succinate dehydrogenase / fumarate reductase flavoprotein subunit